MQEIRYYVKSDSKAYCLLGAARYKTRVSFVRYLWLTLLGYSTFKERIDSNEKV